MAPRSTPTYYDAIEGTCYLVYHLFFILTSAHQLWKTAAVNAVPFVGLHAWWRLTVQPADKGSVFPLPDTNEIVRTAILMVNRCNLCWHVMKPLLTYLLHTIDPSIKISVIRVLPRPKFILQINEMRPADYHTVLCICTAQGKFAFDMTGEQYGLKNAIFLPWSDYMNQYTEEKDFHEDEYHHQNPYSDVQEAEALRAFDEDPIFGFWHRAKEIVGEVVEKWRRGLPNRKIRREDLVSDRERKRLMRLLREEVYRARIA